MFKAPSVFINSDPKTTQLFQIWLVRESNVDGGGGEWLQNYLELAIKEGENLLEQIGANIPRHWLSVWFIDTAGILSTPRNETDEVFNHSPFVILGRHYQKL